MHCTIVQSRNLGSLSTGAAAVGIIQADDTTKLAHGGAYVKKDEQAG